MTDNTTPVPYAADQIAEELESRGCHISVDAVEDVLSLSAAHNSYAKHCGPNAIRCAEDDLLGQALEALRYRKDDLDNQYSLTQDEEYEMERIESILSRLPH